MDKVLIQEIVSTLSLKEEEIFEKIGIEASSVQGAFPPSKQELIAIGKRWWTYHKEQLTNSICDSEAVKKAYNSSDELAVLAAVLDLISGIAIGISPITVAVLLVKLGIDKTCKNKWENQ